jgi:hypothetical protein
VTSSRRRWNHLARPLTDLAKKETQFKWSTECQIAFDFLKKALTSSPVLTIYDAMELVTDASKFGIGGVLHQDSGNGWQPVAFFSQKLQGAELNYPTHDLEMLAVIEGRANVVADGLSRQEAEKRSLGYLVCYAIVVEEDNELEFEEEDYQEEEHKL